MGIRLKLPTYEEYTSEHGAVNVESYKAIMLMWCKASHHDTCGRDCKYVIETVENKQKVIKKREECN